MSDDWIKVRKNLITHPKVVRISSALRADNFQTLGILTSVWAIFDSHSESGRLEGYTTAALDTVVGKPGISAAMKAVGWLEFDPPDATGEDAQALILPRFEAHMGKSAKRRAMELQRKQAERLNEKNVGGMSANDADKMRTKCGPEKEKEKDIYTPMVPKGTNAKSGSDASTIAAIYAAYPRKVGKDTALKAIHRALGRISADDLLAKTTAYAAAVATWPEFDRQFVPHPATWFNRGSYDDDPAEWTRTSPAKSTAPAAQPAKAEAPRRAYEQLPEPEGDWRADAAEEYGEIPADYAWSAMPMEAQRDIAAAVAAKRKGGTP